MKSVNRIVMASAAVVAALATAPAQAFDATNLTMRARALYIQPAHQNGPIAAIGVPSDSIDVQAKFAPDIGLEYAVSDAIGVELLLTVPQDHTVTATQTALGNNVRLGTVTQLTPTLTVKYYLAKKVWMGTSVSLAGTRLASVTIDPWLWGAGVGYRFGQ